MAATYDDGGDVRDFVIHGHVHGTSVNHEAYYSNIFPVAHALGFDLIWFGVVMLLALEMSGITPPFGLTLFVLLGVSPKETSMKDVALSGAPFLFCGLLLFLLMIFFPSIALFLPSLMGG